MAHPYLALRPTRNRLVSHYVVAGSKNPLPLGMGSVKVSNPGEAISQEDLKNIFKRFYQLDASRSVNHGYGLGLAIAESIVQDHKGKIWAESEQGIHTFSVRLPVLS